MSDTEKLDAMHSVRIPERLKAELHLLTISQVTAMNEALRETIARHVHMSKFNPKEYLSE